MQNIIGDYLSELIFFLILSINLL